MCFKLAYRDMILPTTPYFIINHPFYRHKALVLVPLGYNIIPSLFSHHNLHGN
jgi:hypothetical protein